MTIDVKFLSVRYKILYMESKQKVTADVLRKIDPVPERGKGTAEGVGGRDLEVERGIIEIEAVNAIVTMNIHGKDLAAESTVNVLVKTQVKLQGTEDIMTKGSAIKEKEQKGKGGWLIQTEVEKGREILMSTGPRVINIRGHNFALLHKLILVSLSISIGGKVVM